MAKLYPPMIESKLPAQMGDSLIIPFQHSRAVGTGQYKGLSLIIKNAATLTLVDTLKYELKKPSAIQSPVAFNIKQIKSSFTIGQFYKVQLAYIGIDNVVGVYSSPGIFKYTAKPELSVSLQDNLKTLIGSYTSSDLTETVYSYQFDIWDKNNNLLESSEEQLYNLFNSELINSNIYTLSCPISWYQFPDDELVQTITIRYKITTTNLLEQEVESTISINVASKGLPLAINNQIVDMDTGSVSFKNSLTNQYYTGNFYRKRADDYAFVKVLNPDYTIEQGVEYEYRLEATQQYAIITPDFEDMFLSDETHQLRIRFNPKVASFKETIQESKINTIGSRFPISFRNGNTQYKEFSISGLISYEMDNDSLFSKNTFGQLQTQTRETVSIALPQITPATRTAMERKFKLEVLEWLNNGQPKLFRSPTEGNYIIRLNNVSLSPNDQLGRLLHSFNASAYEIAEYTAQNLEKYKVVFKGREFE